MPKTKREIAPDVKKHDICQVATRLFCKFGYEGTSMAAVAAESGVAQNTIYWYFSSKDQLLVSVLDAQIEHGLSDYLAISDQEISERLRWMLDRMTLVAPLIGIVHGRALASRELAQWHDAFHHRLNQFFVERLLSIGLTHQQADTVVKIAVLVFEGLVSHQIEGHARTEALLMLERAVESAVHESAMLNCQHQQQSPTASSV